MKLGVFLAQACRVAAAPSGQSGGGPNRGQMWKQKLLPWFGYQTMGERRTHQKWTDFKRLGGGFKDFDFTPASRDRRWSNLTNIFHIGWNHQRDDILRFHPDLGWEFAWLLGSLKVDSEKRSFAVNIWRRWPEDDSMTSRFCLIYWYYLEN